jgi:hypothetical protein
VEKLKKKLHSRQAEILVVVILLLFSLRVVNWFEYPYILLSGDFRPPLVHEAFVNRVLHTWDEIDFGAPSFYPPRILDPFNLLTTIFQRLSIDLYSTQIMTLFLLYFFASLLMYFFVKRLTSGDIPAAVVAALFLVANVHLVSDREQTAVGFIDVSVMILPSLVTFAKGIDTNSYRSTLISGILFILTYGFFPNYRVALLCGLALFLTALCLFILKGLTTSYEPNFSKRMKIPFDTKLFIQYTKHILVFVISAAVASLWIIALLVPNLTSLLASYKELATPPFVLSIEPHDVFRLIAKWSFYQSAFGKPYVPYASIYMQNILLVVLSYLVPIIAFASLLISKFRKLALYFSIVAILFLLLTSGLNPYLPQLYFAMTTYIPLMFAFRESTNWIFFVVVSYSFLIGIAFSTLYHKCRRKILQLLVLGFAFSLFISSSYPLVTGDVSRNWLNPSIKGAYFPSSYSELNDMLTTDSWALCLPGRQTYIVYNFSQGQFDCGNPYPYIFSKPVITGLGTEYLGSEHPELVNELHELLRTDPTGVPKFLGILGIRYLILEKNIISGNTYGVNELKLNNTAEFVLAKNWEEVALFNNTDALEKLYVADNPLDFTSLDDLYQLTKETGWQTLQHSVFVNTTLSNSLASTALTLPEDFSWQELSPTSYEIHVNSKGPFVLVFLENYDPNWEVAVNDILLPETNHHIVTAFANGWLINKTGDLAITVYYHTQSLLTESVETSAALSVFLLALFSKAELKTVVESIRRRLRHERKSGGINS